MSNKEKSDEKIQKKRKVFPGLKNYESIIVTKSEGVGHLKETFYDIRVFNSDDEDNLYPTKKGVTISALTLRRMASFLVRDLLGVYPKEEDWEEDLMIKGEYKEEEVESESQG